MIDKKKTPLSDEDIALFRNAIADVTPLSQLNIAPPKQPKRTKPDTPSKPFKARQPIHPFVASETAPSVTADQVLHFHQPGLQQRRLKRLRRGNLRAEASIDLHGMSITQAGNALHQFLKTARSKDYRHLLVIHGRGKRSANQYPVLKAHVDHWLRNTRGILAFCSAQPHDGGTGALYLLLKRTRID